MSLAKVAPVTAKRAIPGSIGRGITVALEGFSLQMGGGIAASGARSGRGGGRGDEGGLGRLGPRGRREKPLGGARGRIGAMAGVLF